MEATNWVSVQLVMISKQLLTYGPIVSKHDRRKAMRRFSYVAEYCPSDLSEKLITPSITNDGSKSAVKRYFVFIDFINKCDTQALVYACRKPLSCLNLSPNQIKEQIPNQLNIKLRFDDDFVATTTDGGTEKQFEDLEDDEITINPARRVHNCIF